MANNPAQRSAPVKELGKKDRREAFDGAATESKTVCKVGIDSGGIESAVNERAGQSDETSECGAAGLFEVLQLETKTSLS